MQFPGEYIKVPPHSVEAEQSVIGALLVLNEAWDRIAGVVREDDFYHLNNRLIFGCLAKLIEANKPADVLTVAEELRSIGKLEEAGGLLYLDSMAQNTPSAANIRRYAEIVRDRSVLRQTAAACATISDTCYQTGGLTAMQVLDGAQAKILAISDVESRTSRPERAIGSLMTDVMQHIDERARHPGGLAGIDTGFVDLNEKTDGLQRGDLVIVGGRPSMGKTSFALNIAEHVCLHEKMPALVFSMEMSGMQIAQRMLSTAAKVTMGRMRSGRLEQRDWDRLAKAMADLNDAALSVDDSPALSVGEVRARARRMHRRYGRLGLIVVDYLQLMQTSGGETRATEIAEISRGLKNLARELDVPVVALSQLNRSLEQRPNKRPVMSDLRESGAIEQDADLILFIYRDEVYHPETPDRGTAEVIIGKQRNGPIGMVRLTFNDMFTRFENFGGWPADRPTGRPAPPVRRGMGDAE